MANEAPKTHLPDPNRFFREATARICAQLEPQEALRSCAEYLAPLMPVYKMFLEAWEPDQGVVRTLAEATPKQGREMDRPTAMPVDLRRQILSYRGRPPEEAVFIDNDPSRQPISRRMLEGLGEPLDVSVLVAYCNLHGQPVPGGSVVLLARGLNRFSDDHAALFGLLREPFAIAIRNVLQHRQVVQLKELLAEDNRYLRHELLERSGVDIVGADFGLANVMWAARQAASHDSAVLVLGETGVGKEVIANYIHQASARAGRPLVKVNCGAFPDTLIDSELFGHEKGAFTGAIARKPGRFERANHGTVFLDEVGELPQQAQVRLLRVLQDGRFERVGGVETLEVDIRVIAATNRNLQRLVETGEFREDLWYRLNVLPITVPPLRERRDDIPALVEHFLKKKTAELNLGERPRMDPGMMDRLIAYDWPGNVRELENVIERALILGGGERLSLDQLALRRPTGDGRSRQREPDLLPLEEVVADHIRLVLSRTGGKIHGAGGAAEILRVNPSTLRNRMKKLGIPFGRRAARKGA
jgi:transcriptional regulator with GAF, ATPase, and Fis domain